MTDAREIIAQDGKTLIAQAVTEYFGARCPDYEEGCPCCRAWAAWDRIIGPDEVDQVTVEKCAAVANSLSETWSNSRDVYQAVQEAAASDKANEISAAIRAIGRKA